MKRPAKAQPARDTPARADLLALRDAYKAFAATAVARAHAWNDPANMTNAGVEALVKADADAFEPCQKAWIYATRDVNSEDRYPLVLERMVLRMLREAGLWPDGDDVTEAAYVAVNGPR